MAEQLGQQSFHRLKQENRGRRTPGGEGRKGLARVKYQLPVTELVRYQVSGWFYGRNFGEQAWTGDIYKWGYGRRLPGERGETEKQRSPRTDLPKPVFRQPVHCSCVYSTNIEHLP